MAGKPGFFDLSDCNEALSTAGDPLKRLSAVVDFEVFRGPRLRGCSADRAARVSGQTGSPIQIVIN